LEGFEFLRADLGFSNDNLGEPAPFISFSKMMEYGFPNKLKELFNTSLQAGMLISTVLFYDYQYLSHNIIL
jgi:hypothetical protein